MANEIKLHRSLKHENIVQFIHSFEGKIFKVVHSYQGYNKNQHIAVDVYCILISRSKTDFLPTT